MSDDLHFSNNYHDLSQQYGTGAGFQFEFYCQSCSDTWRSPFAPYRSGQASGWMREIGSLASNLLGGLGGSLDNAVEGIAKAGWGTSRDAAFKEAITAAENHFHRCASCHHYVCDRCFSTDSGLCQTCAPDISTQVQAARHQGKLEAAKDNARELGKSQAGQVDIATERQLVCPQCGCEARGGKFCPDCGHRLAAPDQCTGCQAELPAGSRFCPECGKPANTAVKTG
ncbi:zinc ribbon domain-containing protein [Dyella koreensis]|uniref:Zinc ribbon domain-containing protein n=1 Tax=Dyella koreensis TaxID=311235 RepID=A0ABW8KCD0_9GAMM